MSGLGESVHFSKEGAQAFRQHVASMIQEAVMQDLRTAVADALTERRHGNAEFIRQVREGAQDDGPFMVGAIAGLRLGLAMQGEADV